MQFSLYEAGDMLQTPDGKGVVITDQKTGSAIVLVELADGEGSHRPYHINDVQLMQPQLA
jgi:hypothetical protein